MLYYKEVSVSPSHPYIYWLFAVAAVACAAGMCFAWLFLSPDTPPRPVLPVRSRQSSAAAHSPLPPQRQCTFPAGGRQLSGAYRMVALYGTPDSPALGALGDQPLAASITRVKELAAAYQPLSTEPIYPTFEIIATIASASATENGDYSRETDPAAVLAWAKAAQDAGVYVVLDLQPGRSSFLAQAKLYEQALLLPNVGLALDPEWRLGPSQVHLQQIGTVSAAEVNEVSQWLAGLTKQQHLPQKLFLLHQFRLTMLPDRQAIDTARSELAYVIQMDGQGSQAAKQDTWRAITAAALPGVTFGWKNFYRQDTPLLDPAATMNVQPKPWYISYQ